MLINALHFKEVVEHVVEGLVSRILYLWVNLGFAQRLSIELRAQVAFQQLL
jgi:hypothetical protein